MDGVFHMYDPKRPSKTPFFNKKKKKSHLFVCFCLLIHGISLAKQVPPQLDGHIFYYQKTFGSHQV